MMNVKAQDTPASLRDRVTGLEARLVLRRQRLRALKADANQKMAARLTSPLMLLAATGAGAAIEQAGHRQVGAVAQVIQAANAGTRLFLMLKLFGQQIAGNSGSPEL